MPQEPKPQLADSLLAELRPLIQATPHTCRDDLWTALTVAISVHCDALRSSAAPPGDRDAELRQVGHVWAAARHPLDPLLSLLSALTEKVLDLAGPPHETVVTATGAGIIRVILASFQQSYGWAPKDSPASGDLRLLATALLWDLEVSPTHRRLLAENYAVIALRKVGQSSSELDEAQILRHFDRVGVSGTLPFLTEPISYILVPTADKRHATELAEELHRELPQTSLAVAWRRRDEVPAGRLEARDITRIVAAAERPPGVYQIDDVLVEYAILQKTSVTNQLVGILAPLANLPILLTTLKSFTAANGNRRKAAADLGIHRKTLDHRLQRIKHITGTDATSAEGLQLLYIALATFTTVHFDSSEQNLGFPS